MTIDHAIDLAVAEVSRARTKHGDFIERSDDYLRNPVLVEEIGEVADVLNELSLGNLTREQATQRLIEELTQVSATAIRWTAALLSGTAIGDAPPGFRRCKTPGCHMVTLDDSPSDMCPVCVARAIEPTIDKITYGLSIEQVIDAVNRIHATERK